MLLKLMMEQKTQLEQQQIQLNNIQKQQTTASVLSCDLKNSIDTSEFDTMILDAKRGMMAASTTNVCNFMCIRKGY